MITIRPAAQRGHFDFGWLDTWHTFSFGDYHDPRWMGFRSLRVINDDRVAPRSGFPTHPHRDMEILTYVLEGALRHEDSTGAGGIIRRGDVQRMTAGTGVTHSEANGSSTEAVHLLQIWILPETRGLPPGYEQRAFGDAEKRNRLRLICSRDARDGSLAIHQDVAVLASILDEGQGVERPLAPGRAAWVQVATGAVSLNGRPLEAGDGAGLTEEIALRIDGRSPESEVLVFDLA